MPTPFFSIVTPVYNGSAYISSFSESLLSQTFQDWEAIIIDDCSTDDTFSKLAAIAESDFRFHLYQVGRNDPQRYFPGPYRARNIALRRARGQYICFLDVDDYWLPHKLSDQYELLRNKPRLQLVFSNYYKVDASLSTGYLKPRLPVLSVKSQMLFCNPIPMLTSCVSRDISTLFKFQPLGHEDYLFWSDITANLDENEISISTRPAALYRSSVHSQSSDKLQVLYWWIRCYKEKGYPLIASILLLACKICMELIEIFLARIGFFASYRSN